MIDKKTMQLVDEGRSLSSAVAIGELARFGCHVEPVSHQAAKQADDEKRRARNKRKSSKKGNRS